MSNAKHEREKWVEQVFGGIPYVPAYSDVDEEHRRRIKMHTDRLRKSVADFADKTITIQIYDNERILAIYTYSMGIDSLEGIDANVALEKATDPANTYTSKDWLRIAECLEKRQQYSYRLF